MAPPQHLRGINGSDEEDEYENESVDFENDEDTTQTRNYGETLNGEETISDLQQLTSTVENNHDDVDSNGELQQQQQVVVVGNVVDVNKTNDDPFGGVPLTEEEDGEYAAEMARRESAISFTQSSFNMSQSQAHFVIDESQSSQLTSVGDDEGLGVVEATGGEGEDFLGRLDDDDEEGGDEDEEEVDEVIAQSRRQLQFDDTDLFDNGMDSPLMQQMNNNDETIVAAEDDDDAISTTTDNVKEFLASSYNKRLDDDEDGNEAVGDDNSANYQQLESQDHDETGQHEDEGPTNTTALMANIFGDEELSNDEDETPHRKQSQGDEEGYDPAPAAVGSDDEDGYGRMRGPSDFDEMMRQKKLERRIKRRRAQNGDYDLISDADDVIKDMVVAMTEAANDDRNANTERRPAIRKLLMLAQVRRMLLRADLFDALLDGGMMSAVSEWLAPLPDKSLPALEIRSTLLNILDDGFTHLEQGILKQSGIGKAVMFLFKHPKELRENKTKAARLIREWSRPIFQLDTDFRSISREERVQRDFLQMPEAKRARIRVDSDGLPMPNLLPNRRGSDADNAEDGPETSKKIARARVPQPSTKDYVIRPKSEIEGTFRGSTKKQLSTFDRKIREFKDRVKPQRRASMHAVSVSLEGRKMV